MKHFITAILLFFCITSYGQGGVLVGNFSEDQTYRTDSLSGYWPFDGDFLDYSGNGLHGTNNGGNIGFTTNKNGTSNSAIYLPGDLSYFVDLGDSSLIKPTGALSVCVWIQGESATLNESGIVNLGGSGERGWLLGWRNDGLTGAYIAEDATTLYFIRQPESNDSSVWAHFAMIYDPGDSLCIYKNGVQILKNVSNVPASMYRNSLPVNVGRRPQGSAPWEGKFDDLFIYRDVITENELQIIMNNVDQ